MPAPALRFLRQPLVPPHSMPGRSFPPPSAEEQAACFVVRDHHDQGARLRLFRGRAGGRRRGLIDSAPKPGPVPFRVHALTKDSAVFQFWSCTQREIR